MQTPSLKTVAFIQANLLLAVLTVAGGAFAWRQFSPASPSGGAVVVPDRSGDELLDAVTASLEAAGNDEAAALRAELYRGLAELVRRDGVVKSTDHFRRLHGLAGGWTFGGRVQPLPAVNAACEAYLTHVMGGKPNVTLDAAMRATLAKAFEDLAAACERAL